MTQHGSLLLFPLPFGPVLGGFLPCGVALQLQLPYYATMAVEFEGIEFLFLGQGLAVVPAPLVILPLIKAPGTFNFGGRRRGLACCRGSTQAKRP